MSAPAARNIIRIPGEIHIGVTSLTIGAHGGTRIGNARAHVWEPRARYQDVIAEEFGGAVVRSYYIGSRPMLAAVLRGYDPDAVANLFPQSALVSGSSPSRAKTTATVNASTRGATEPTPTTLLFLPRAYRHHPALLLYRAVPQRDRQQRMEMAAKSDYEMPVAWMATPDEQGRVFERCMIEDMTL